jgi:hypothetical protein
MMFHLCNSGIQILGMPGLFPWTLQVFSRTLSQGVGQNTKTQCGSSLHSSGIGRGQSKTNAKASHDYLGNKAIGTFAVAGPNYSDSEMRAPLHDVHRQPRAARHAIGLCPTPVLTPYFLWSHFPVFLLAELRF